MARPEYAGWVAAGDAALGVQLVWRCVAGTVLQHCQRGCGPAAGALTLLWTANGAIVRWRRASALTQPPPPTEPGEKLGDQQVPAGVPGAQEGMGGREKEEERWS